MLVTKGDLFDQERKFAGSGMAEHDAPTLSRLAELPDWLAAHR